MSADKTIQKLQSLAAHSPVASDVFHAWATRDRARREVMIPSLHRRMAAEKFKHSKDEYAKMLKSLADIGLGQPVVDRKGKFKGLRNVRVTLQSIGKAALGEEAEGFQNVKEKRTYMSLVQGGNAAAAAQGPKPEPKQQAAQDEVKPVAAAAPVELAFQVNGRTARLELPDTMTSEEIAVVMASLRGK